MAPRFALPLLVLAALAGLFAMSYSALSRASARAREADPEPQLVSPLPPPPAPIPAPTPRPAKPKPPRWMHRVAVVRRSVPLRERPNGRVVAEAGPRTEFGSARVLSVAARRGPWLGVVATEMPNGRLAWLHARNRGLGFRRTAYSLHADLSGRWIELRRGGRRIRRITVAVGRPGSET